MLAKIKLLVSDSEVKEFEEEYREIHGKELEDDEPAYDYFLEKFLNYPNDYFEDMDVDIEFI